MHRAEHLSRKVCECAGKTGKEDIATHKQAAAKAGRTLLKKLPALQGRELWKAGSALILLALVRLQALAGRVRRCQGSHQYFLGLLQV